LRRPPDPRAAQSRYTPIIFLTAGHSDDQQVFQGYATGAVDYLLMPAVPEIPVPKRWCLWRWRKSQNWIRRQTELLEQREKAARELAEEKVRLLEEIDTRTPSSP